MPLPPTDYFPQTLPTHRPLVMWLVLLAWSLLVVLLILAVPVFASSGNSGLAGGIYQSFGFVCHQLPERSFFIFGHKLAVCSRCTGIYFGAMLAFLLYPLIRSLRATDTPPRKWLIAASLPLFLDFLLNLAGVWQNTHASRFVTGLILGSVVVFYVMPGVVELSLRSWRGRSKQVMNRSQATQNPLPFGQSDYSAPERRI